MFDGAALRRYPSAGRIVGGALTSVKVAEPLPPTGKARDTVGLTAATVYSEKCVTLSSADDVDAPPAPAGKGQLLHDCEF